MHVRRSGAPSRIRFLPWMRSAYIERFESAPDATTYFVHEEYLDRSLLDGQKYVKTTRLALVFRLLRGDYDVFAVPEPFWVVEAPYTTLIVLIARLSTWLRGRPISVVTYAIENADSSSLLGLPTWVPARFRRLALSLFALPLVLGISRFAFGTDGARANYLTGLAPWIARRVSRRSAYFPPLAPICSCAGLSKEPGTVLFLGPLATRKGFDTLLEAWPTVVARAPGAKLWVCGQGVLQDDLDRAIEQGRSITQILGASRLEIHELLARAEVLVSLPRSESRWREQIGLSIVEGLSHRCHIVTTSDTGIADWLALHGQTVIADGRSSSAAADALSKALCDPVAADDLPSVNGRAVAERWMFGCDANVRA